MLVYGVQGQSRNMIVVAGQSECDADAATYTVRVQLYVAAGLHSTERVVARLLDTRID